MKEDLLKIIEHFGINNQQRKLHEELFELNEAITIYEQGNNQSCDDIVEEIADVCVILRQFMGIYNITQDEISEKMANKINRTLERIESGYYEK